MGRGDGLDHRQMVTYELVTKPDRPDVTRL